MDTFPVLTRSRHATRLAAAFASLLLAVLTLLAGPAASAAVALVDDDVIDLLDVDGRIIEFTPDASLEAAANRANEAGIAFAWLDRVGADDNLAIDLADEFVDQLSARGSRYRTVLVFVDDGFAASSLTRSQAELDDALDNALPGFADGDMGRGLDAFTTTLGGSDAGSAAPTSVPSTGDGGSSDSGGGIGFGTILLVVAAIGGGFLLIRRMLTGRKSREQAEVDLAEDRAEIEEQLKNNADRVISLGDRVIAKGDRELISLYEEASATYQDVSQRIDDAETAAEIDELDDRIDHAEWQFEVIEADLDGRPRPRAPTPDDVLDGDPTGGAAQDGNGDRVPADSGSRRLPPPPQAPSGRGRPDVVTSPRTGRSYPRSGAPRQRRGGGGLGGALGGGLGSILANIVLGGGLGGASRRTRRRSSRGGFGSGGLGGGGLGGGGLGGGVLRRGGGSRSRSQSRSTSRPRSRSRSSGGRSIGGRSRSRGGRRI